MPERVHDAGAHRVQPSLSVLPDQQSPRAYARTGRRVAQADAGDQVAPGTLIYRARTNTTRRALMPPAVDCKQTSVRKQTVSGVLLLFFYPACGWIYREMLWDRSPSSTPPTQPPAPALARHGPVQQPYSMTVSYSGIGLKKSRSPPSNLRAAKHGTQRVTYMECKTALALMTHRRGNSGDKIPDVV
jgi:hypothetical protein